MIDCDEQLGEVLFDPKSSKCLSCSKSFNQPIRKQGGGTITLYCSARCRARDWARNNKEKRTISILKYEANPLTKLQKKERSLKAKFAKYNVTEDWFAYQLTVQAYRCSGCNKLIDKYSARIDHNHTTGKVRGLLCDHCNWAIGHAKDSVETLENLIRHLKEYND